MDILSCITITSPSLTLRSNYSVFPSLYFPINVKQDLLANNEQTTAPPSTISNFPPSRQHSFPSFTNLIIFSQFSKQKKYFLQFSNHQKYFLLAKSSSRATLVVRVFKLYVKSTIWFFFFHFAIESQQIFFPSISNGKVNT